MYTASLKNTQVKVTPELASILAETVPYLVFPDYEICISRDKVKAAHAEPIVIGGEKVGAVEFGSGKPYHRIWTIWKLDEQGKEILKRRMIENDSPRWFGELVAEIERLGNNLYGDCSDYFKILSVYEGVLLPQTA